MSQKIPVAIIGATGYTGLELVRLLLPHPRAEIAALTSRQYAGTAYADYYPVFRGKLDLKLEKPQISKLARKIKAAFLCLPHHESMDMAKSLRSKGVKVIDLSADFRIKNVAVYNQWYGPHSQKNLLGEAVYGLPELYKPDIRKTKLVACPGCYPTSIILALAPLLKNKMILSSDIICDSKSGVTGAGRNAKIDILFSEVNDNFKAYHIAQHRHSPEIDQELSVLAGESVHALFSPHLVPMDRGILSTIYCKPVRKWAVPSIIKVYQKFYKKEKMITILPQGQFPSTIHVRGTNECHISITYDEKSERLIICSAIDNLTKGASGQAVQCFNLMYGIPEYTGLQKIALLP